MLQTAGAIGWRAQVTAKGRDKGSNKPKVKVFGQWYALEDESVIRPIEQVDSDDDTDDDDDEADSEEDDDADEEEGSGEEAEEAEEEAGAGASDETGSKRSRPDARELDSSGHEIPPNRPSKRKC